MVGELQHKSGGSKGGYCWVEECVQVEVEVCCATAGLGVAVEWERVCEWLERQ